MWITNMRQAFDNAQVKQNTSAAVVNACARAMRGDAGILKTGKEWNASLSFKTAKALKEQGIL